MLMHAQYAELASDKVDNANVTHPMAGIKWHLKY